jgi:ubiquinone/menaquinone biosynthesis C-methylase UbiE
MLHRNRQVAKRDIAKLDLLERVRLEAKITDDRIASINLERYRDIDLDAYVSTFAWRRYLFGFLGDVRGKHVLDICCGYSMTPVMLAKAGANVVAVDVAPRTLECVAEVAAMHEVSDRVYVHCGPVEQLPFPDQSFDVIYGGAALHHLQLDRAGQELSRLLRRGGRGGFQDPLGHNPVLEFARDNLNYRHKHPVKGTDHPLRVREIDSFGRYFASYIWRGFDLLTMAVNIIPGSWPYLSRLERVDEVLLSRIPFIQRYARFSVTCVTN